MSFDPCCGVPEVNNPQWTYVGPGQGHYNQVQQYKPSSGGSFILKDQPDPRPVWWRRLCMVVCCLVSVLLLAFAIYFFLSQQGHKPVIPVRAEVKKTSGGLVAPGLLQVTFGSSLGSTTKCIVPNQPVICDSQAEQLTQDDQYPDTFDVYHNPNDRQEVCAHRTDANAGWGLHLVLACRKDPQYHETYQQVAVGPSTDSSTKCVMPHTPVQCDAEASQRGRHDDFPDSFRVFSDGHRICAKRTDTDRPWGLNLVLFCHKDQRYEQVDMGPSLDSSTKCVTPTTAVNCHETASVQTTDQTYPDKFRVYHAAGQICAKRIDTDRPWGLNLVLVCQRTTS